MKGYKIIVGLNPEQAGSFAYFLNKNKAIEWAKELIKLEVYILDKKQSYLIEKVNLKKCSLKNCDNLIEIDDFRCLKCDKIFDDLLLEKEV